MGFLRLGLARNAFHSQIQCSPRSMPSVYPYPADFPLIAINVPHRKYLKKRLGLLLADQFALMPAEHRWRPVPHLFDGLFGALLAWPHSRARFRQGFRPFCASQCVPMHFWNPAQSVEGNKKPRNGGSGASADMGWYFTACSRPRCRPCGHRLP